MPMFLDERAALPPSTSCGIFQSAECFLKPLSNPCLLYSVYVNWRQLMLRTLLVKGASHLVTVFWFWIRRLRLNYICKAHRSQTFLGTHETVLLCFCLPRILMMDRMFLSYVGGLPGISVPTQMRVEEKRHHQWTNAKTAPEKLPCQVDRIFSFSTPEPQVGEGKQAFTEIVRGSQQVVNTVTRVFIYFSRSFCSR